jgi:Zinc-binding dehydrogenase
MNPYKFSTGPSPRPAANETPPFMELFHVRCAVSFRPPDASGCEIQENACWRGLVVRRLQEWIPHICHSETEPVCYPSLPKKRRFHPRRRIHVINYQQHADWSERLAAWTGGRGVDHVIEVGGPGTLAQSIRACQVGGHISLIGVAGDVPTAFMMVKQIRLQSLIVGAASPRSSLCARWRQPALDR